MNSITVGQAKTKKELEQILPLQALNHPHNLTAEQRAKEGFVTVKHNLEVLQKMNNAVGQIIAKDRATVVGYALVMLEEFKTMISVLTPMFEMFTTLSYRGRPLTAYRYYVMGQICVAEHYRGIGIFEKLYAEHKRLLADRFDFCLTEISVKNTRSMRAHEKVGFKTIHTFSDNTDNWNIVLWDWR